MVKKLNLLLSSHLELNLTIGGQPPQDISKLNTVDIIIYNSKGFDSWLNQFKQSKLIDINAGLEH